MTDFLIEESTTEASLADGLRYLLDRGPENWLAVSTYEGWGTRNLADCVLFHEKGVAGLGRGYELRPERFLIRDCSGSLQGVMSTVTLPEFGAKLDYESYVVIEAEDASAYRCLLEHALGPSRLEVVTYRQEHLEWVNVPGALRDTHNWVLLGWRAVRAIPNTATRVDPKTVESVPPRTAKGYVADGESWLHASHCESAGMPYLNLSESSVTCSDSVFLGLRKCSSKSWEVVYCLGAEAIGDSALLEAAIERLPVDERAIYWRMRVEDYDVLRGQTEDMGFRLLTRESHLHYACRRCTGLS